MGLVPTLTHLGHLLVICVKRVPSLQSWGQFNARAVVEESIRQFSVVRVRLSAIIVPSVLSLLALQRLLPAHVFCAVLEPIPALELMIAVCVLQEHMEQ